MIGHHAFEHSFTTGNSVDRGIVRHIGIADQFPKAA